MINVTQSHTIHASRFFIKTETQTDKHNMIPGELSVVGCHLIILLYHSIHFIFAYFSSVISELRSEFDCLSSVINNVLGLIMLIVLFYFIMSVTLLSSETYIVINNESVELFSFKNTFFISCSMLNELTAGPTW